MAAAYGSNVTSYGTNTGNMDVETAKKKIADLGQAWAAAKTQQEKDAIHNQATSIGTAAGGTYNAKTGTWDFTNALKSTQEQPVQSGPNAMDLIRSSYENNYAAQAQKLRAARDQALAALAGQDDLVKQTAYNNRNSNDVVAAQRLQALREAMAAQGLGSSGDSISGQLAIGTSQQQAASDINTNEANALKQLLAQRAAIVNNANADDLALMQQLQAARDTALVNQMNADRSYGLDLAGLSGVLPGGGQTLAAQQFNWGKTMDTAGLTGYLNGQRTLAGQQFDLQKAAQEWNQAFQQGQFDWQKASDIWERAFKEKNFDQSVKQFAAQMGLDWARLNQQQQQFVADQAFKNKAFEADQYWKQQDYNWMTSPNNPSNFSKQPTAEDYAKFIDSSPNAFTITGFGSSAIKTPNKTEIEKMILSSGLPISEMTKLYQRYGIPLNQG